MTFATPYATEGDSHPMFDEVSTPVCFRLFTREDGNVEVEREISSGYEYHGETEPYVSETFDSLDAAWRYCGGGSRLTSGRYGVVVYLDDEMIVPLTAEEHGMRVFGYKCETRLYYGDWLLARRMGYWHGLIAEGCMMRALDLEDPEDVKQAAASAAHHAALSIMLRKAEHGVPFDEAVESTFPEFEEEREDGPRQ